MAGETVGVRGRRRPGRAASSSWSSVSSSKVSRTAPVRGSVVVIAIRLAFHAPGHCPTKRDARHPERNHADADLAGTAVPAGCDVRRGRGQLRAVLRGRRQGRAVPDRGPRQGDPRRAGGDRRLRPPRLPARRPARAALRLPGARPVRPVAGAPLQPGQAAARPLREGHRGPDRRRRVAVLLHVRPQELVQRPRQPGAHDALRGGEPVLRLGQRPPPRARVPRDGDLRGARQGPHDDPPGRARGDPRDVRRHRPPRGHRPPQGARGQRDRADAGPPVRAGHPPRGPGARELLGLQHHRVLRAAQRLLRHRAARPAGAGVQVDGEGAARGRHRGDPRRGLQPHRRGQRARSRRSPSAASTTRRTTGSSTTTRRTTTTPPAPGTPCSCGTRTCCS